MNSAKIIAVSAIMILGISLAPTFLVPDTSPEATSILSSASHLPLPSMNRAKKTFLYSFNTNETLDESDSPADSRSPYWWLDSGGELIISDGVGKTIQGPLATMADWRLSYVLSNPLDTDGGYHPQNIFRLITKSKWADFGEQAYFAVVKENLSSSPNRNNSNGLLLFGRYQSGGDLYYAGIRVDGAAVIKKKVNGTYYELAYKQFFKSSPRQTGPNNLIPKGEWIGLRFEVKNIGGNKVQLSLLIDQGKSGKWQSLVNAIDSGEGGGPIARSGSGGIRTDFMDVLFSDFYIEEL